MSGKIEVRVWNGTRMLEFPDLAEWDIGDYDAFIEACRDGGKPPMLSTGYKDLDGKSVWDGDILLDCSPVEVNPFSSGKIWLVEWPDERAAFRVTYFEDGAARWIIHLKKQKVAQCRVVGNIIQNGELLK